jgi:Domain of Unknown Function with PDB structure (DUF3857)
VNKRRVAVVCTFVLPMVAMCLWKASIVNGDEWLPISQEELKMTSLPEAPGAPAVMLYRQVDRNDSTRAGTEYDYQRIKVLTEAGRQYANVEIAFEKGRENVTSIRARTIRPDGTIANFDGKIYEQTIEKTKGQKVLAKTFTLPDVQVGSIIEYHFNYDFEDNYIFSSNWTLSEELFTKKAVFTLKPYERSPWNLQWSWPAGLPKGTEPPKQGPDHIVRMTSENIPAFVEEDHMPPPNELKFRVNFIYRDEVPELDPVKYWRDFNKKKYGQTEAFVEKRKAMEEAVSGIIAPGDSAEVKLQKIYARVQQIQNLSYLPAKSLDERKHENMKENSNVEELWKHQYGNGYDLTWLFLGLVRAAGFEAYPCLVSSRSEYFFLKQRVNGRELNANVVLVKVNGKDEYFDPGAAFTPYGLLPWMETGVEGLRLDKNGGTWIETSMPTSEQARVERSAKLKISSEGDIGGKLTVRYTGLDALAIRVAQRNEDEAARKKNLEDAVKESIPAGSEVELSNQPDWQSGNTPLVAEFQLKVPGWTASAGRRALLPTGLFTAQEKHLFENAGRVWPVYFPHPYSTVDDLTFELPAGWKVETLPKDLDRDAKALQYTLKVENKEGAVHVQRLLRCEVVMIPKDKYSILRNFYQLVKTQDEQQAILLPGGASAAN